MMACPFCHQRLDAWRELHRHLADEHGDVVDLQPAEADTPPSFRVVCPACAWAFVQPLRGQRRDAAFLAEHREAMSLVAFDQLMLHWVEDHAIEIEETPLGGTGGNSERM